MDMEDCTLDTCPIEEAYIHYQPSIAGNGVLVGLFSALLIAQAVQTPIYRMWGFSGSMITGLLLEILGYAARVLFHDDPFSFDWFLMNLICLSLGPVFFCAALYFLLGRIVIVYQGEDVSRLKPRWYAIIFVSCDVIALILQSAGGAITSQADDDNPDQRNMGINIMIAGLAFQVAVLTMFIYLGAEFAFRLRRRMGRMSQFSTIERKSEFEKLRASRWWKVFLCAMPLATITVYTRSIYRVIELQGGYDSEIANDEVAFMILEGAMVSITCLCLTIPHPGEPLGTRPKKGVDTETVEMRE